MTFEMNEFLNSKYFEAYKEKIEHLNINVLYQSGLHGPEHIIRVILFGSMIAFGLDLNPKETNMILDACAYHDTGRENDLVDPLHGKRSAEKLSGLVDWTGDELAILEAIVEGHSRHDEEIVQIMEERKVVDKELCKKLFEILKDADALDRFRLGPDDLNPNKLRTSISKCLIEAARELNKK